MSQATQETQYDHIPDPPRIPGDPNPDTNLITDFWDDNAFQLSALIDRSTRQFLVRPIASFPPQASKLGSPNDKLDWNLLLEKHGLQILNAAGFIDHPERYSPSRVEIPILPPFRYQHWPGTSREDYKLLEPVLKWVSAILSDPDVLPFYAALMFQPLQQGNSEDSGTYQFYRPDDTLSKADQEETFRLLCNMSRYLRWHISDDADNKIRLTCNGRTSRMRDENKRLMGGASIAGMQTCSSIIRLNRTFLDNLRRYNQDPLQHREYLRQCQVDSQVSPDRMIDPNEHSAFLRTSFKLGITIIHELTHAVENAYRVPYINEKNITFVEPFYCDHRINEVGWALEHYLTKGHTYSMFISPKTIQVSGQFRAMPFGLFMKPMFGTGYRDGGGQNYRALRGPDPHQKHFYYPVPQKYIDMVVSQVWWDTVEARFGVKAMVLPRFEKWKVDADVAAHSAREKVTLAESERGKAGEKKDREGKALKRKEGEVEGAEDERATKKPRKTEVPVRRRIT